MTNVCPSCLESTKIKDLSQCRCGLLVCKHKIKSHRCPSK